jgi:glycosyltransferase involved in cell wall biosynthesis
VDLVVIAPTRWRDTLRTTRFEAADDEGYRLVPTRTLRDGHSMSTIYDPWAVWQVTADFRPDIVHVEEEPGSLALFQAALLKRRFGYRLLFFTWENIYRPPRLPLLERFNLAQADHAIAGTHPAHEVLRRKGFRRPVAVIPQLGLDPALFRPRPSDALRARLGLTGFVIGYVGRLVEEKGLRTLVEAARMENDIHLLFLGQGPFRDDLTRMVEAHTLADRTVFADPVPHERVPYYVSCMDALVLPSRTTRHWKEQFGHVLIEAMACGVPVVGSDSGAIPEVIGQAGLIFPEGDAEQLRARLVQLMDDAALRARLGRAGRERVLAHYTDERIAEATCSLYQEVMTP